MKKKKDIIFFLTCIIDDQELTGYHTHWNIWVFLCSHGNKKKKMTSKRNSSVRREVWDSLRTFVFVIIGGGVSSSFRLIGGLVIMCISAIVCNPYSQLWSWSKLRPLPLSVLMLQNELCGAGQPTHGALKGFSYAKIVKGFPEKI